MGKKEMEPIPIRLLVVMMLLVTIPFGIYLFLWSMPADQLESQYVQRAEFQVDQVTKVHLLGGGLALVAQDAAGNGLLKAYAKVPLLNRYMPTDTFDFTDQGEPINFRVRVWIGSARVTWNQGKSVPSGETEWDGWGIGEKLLFNLFWIELCVAAFVLIRNDVIKTRKEKAAAPVKNY